MSFRFFKRLNILPGVTLNLSKSGPSLSVGPRGARVTIGRTGTRATVGIPGTGMSYTTKLGGKKPKRSATGRKKKTKAETAAAQAASQTDAFEGAIARASGDEKALIEGSRALMAGDEAGALARLRQAAGLADGAFLAGFLALRQDRADEAVSFLSAALQRESMLGQSLAKFGLQPAIDLPITEEISADIQPGSEGVLLALAETYERLGRRPEAIEHLRRIHQLDPEDAVIRVSLAELLLETEPVSEEARHEVVRLAEGVENETPIHTAMLLYKAKALRGLGLNEAALDVLTEAVRRKKDRPAELMGALHYERGLLYDAAAQPEKARVEFQKTYSFSPDYEDVAARLGIGD